MDKVSISRNSVENGRKMASRMNLNLEVVSILAAWLLLRMKNMLTRAMIMPTTKEPAATAR